MDAERALAFFQSRFDVPLEEAPPEVLSDWRVVEALWPLNELFRPNLHKIRSLPYRPRFEAAGDAAILAFAEAPVAATWAGLSSGAWRVLLERHEQMRVVALANEAAGNPMITIPAGLNEHDRSVGLMLLLLLPMKLPYKPADRSPLEMPEGPRAFELGVRPETRSIPIS